MTRKALGENSTTPFCWDEEYSGASLGEERSLFLHNSLLLLPNFLSHGDCHSLRAAADQRLAQPEAAKQVSRASDGLLGGKSVGFLAQGFGLQVQEPCPCVFILPIFEAPRQTPQP